jgi:hypothetical protein
VATTNKIPTLGFGASIAGVVLLGFGGAIEPLYADPAYVLVRAEVSQIRMRADDVFVQMRADDQQAQLVADDIVVLMRADDTTITVN